MRRERPWWLIRSFSRTDKTSVSAKVICYPLPRLFWRYCRCRLYPLLPRVVILHAGGGGTVGGTRCPVVRFISDAARGPRHKQHTITHISFIVLQFLFLVGTLFVLTLALCSLHNANVRTNNEEVKLAWYYVYFCSGHSYAYQC